MSKKISVSLILFTILITGLWIWTLVAPGKIISIGGSMSVDPIIQHLTNKYKTDRKESGNFVYSSTGSQAGINNMNNGVYKIGFISKNVPADVGDFIDDKKAYLGDKFKTADEYYQFVQENSGIHASNFAKDSLVFIYNDKDKGFENFSKLLKIEIEDKDNKGKYVASEFTHKMLDKIYNVNHPNDLMTWRELAQFILDYVIKEKIDLSKDGLSLDILQNDLLKVKNDKIIPFSTSPGSGTKSSFTEFSGVTPGTAVNIYPSNGSVFSQIKASSGAFGYVSMSYAKYLAEPSLNLKLKWMNVVNLSATAQEEKEQNPISLFVNKQLYKYKLTRNFNALFNTTLLTRDEIKEVCDFVYYFSLDDSLENEFLNEGLIRPWKSEGPK
ncbi:phosphate ABC transporter substrate-binding protein [Williamsoniiplasma somnilux]|uniref:Phosphate ABC transporter substrate-binding protein n=1 Tax=Williamsoniiplasma somnilux TaxID=215578 RepID=A0A2K8NXR4_9MOLU|nr:phosphate ABC transporter substrate-binding protein [Williamsoniiplasma somnilux]ATZ18610.1 phosphate ABC transporter substrate-binding protein [Williamsoniiplasma somnilux]